jgi:hypothetical protein
LSPPDFFSDFPENQQPAYASPSCEFMVVDWWWWGIVKISSRSQAMINCWDGKFLQLRRQKWNGTTYSTRTETRAWKD